VLIREKVWSLVEREGIKSKLINFNENVMLGKEK
jgi:hypothetical protein